MTTNSIIDNALAEGRHLLYADEAVNLLTMIGIPVNPCRVAADENTAIAAADEIGYPVALKIRSQVITHKTDFGGVILGIKDQAAFRQAYSQMMKKTREIDPAAQVTVEPMATAGVELFVGMTDDQQFGPVMAFGLGGTLLELYNDTTFRLIPLKRDDAADMLKSIKGAKILEGYRGQHPVDKEALIDMILNLSRLVESAPQIKEIDLNPVFAYSNGVLAVDARIIIDKTP